MEYRHGPISIGDDRSLVWMLGRAPDGLRDEVAATGATWVASTLDPVAELIRAQRVAVAIGHARGLDPDNPRNLTRSVILDPA
jgi:fructoselysine-6-P-deglycase FrlB-like protein